LIIPKICLGYGKHTVYAKEKLWVSLKSPMDIVVAKLIVDKENCPSETEFGRLILRVFPEVKKIQKTIEERGTKKKCWLHSNLTKCESHTVLTWDNIAETYSPPKPTTSAMC
jgi:hypothetical protein